MTYTIALIGARSGSSLKDKNIRPLARHPLIAYSILCALRAVNIHRVIVSTDSPEYAEIAKSYGAEVPFIQPAPTAGALSGDYPFIAHALDWMRVHDERLPDLIVHLRPTTPLREPGIIAAAVKTLEDNVVATALRSVHEMPESAHKCFEIFGGYLRTMHTESFELDASNRARQAYPTTYHPNGYVDVLRTDFIRNSQLYGTRMIHGNRVIPFVTPPVIEADTEEDFAMLEYQVGRDPHFTGRLFE